MLKVASLPMLSRKQNQNVPEIETLDSKLVFLFHRFNFIPFSSEAVSWKPHLVENTEENCQEAVEWISGFEANGSTCTLDALQVRFFANVKRR